MVVGAGAETFDLLTDLPREPSLGGGNTFDEGVDGQSARVLVLDNARSSSSCIAMHLFDIASTAAVMLTVSLALRKNPEPVPALCFFLGDFRLVHRSTFLCLGFRQHRLVRQHFYAFCVSSL